MNILRNDIKNNKALVLILLPVTLLLFSIYNIKTTTNAATGIYEVINAQGKLVDSDGTNASATCIATNICDFRFTIYSASSGGDNLWQETQSNIVVTDGIFNVKLGSVTSLNDVDLENFNRDDLWVLIEFDANGDGDFADGVDQTFSPRIHMSSVAYAFNSKYLGGAAGGSYLRSDTSDNYTSGTLTIDGGTTLHINGDLTVSDQTIVFDAATFSAFDITGDLRFLASGDDDDYIFINTTSNEEYLFFEDASLAYTNDPGFRLNSTSGELEYRDEDASGWTSFDSLSTGSATDRAKYDRVVAATGGTDTTIAAAITNSSAGDSIFIAPGLYEENIDIDKEVKLYGAGQGATIIQGNTGDETIEILADVDNVVIADLTIDQDGTASTDFGIVTIDGTGSHDYTTIQNVEVMDGYGGMQIIDSNNTTISNCYVHGSTWDGIRLGGNRSIIQSNHVYNVEADGINITTSNNSTIDGNTVYNWGNDADECGICVSGGDNVITDNNLHGASSSYRGIYISSNRNVISGNSIKSITTAGIQEQGSDYNTYSNNMIETAADGILFADDADYNTISSNTIVTMSDDGIDLGGTNSSNNTIIGNTFYSITGDEITNYSGNANKLVANNTGTDETFYINGTAANTTLTINNPDGTYVANLSVEGDLTVSGGDITGANVAQIDLGEAVSGNIQFYANSDTDDFIFINTTSNEEYLFFEDASLAYTNDPGLKLNSTSGELEYRDEDSASWVSFDSIAAGASLWTDGGTYLYPTGAEDIQLGDGDWIGNGSGANQPYITFDDTNNYFEFMGGNVGIGIASPDYIFEIYDATNTPAFALSDDDVLHGVTTLAQTDTFFHISSISTTIGGAQITGLADASGIALGLKGVQSSNPTDTTPAISLIGTKANGTGVQDLADTETVLQIANNDNTAAFTILGNGKVGIGTTAPEAVLHNNYTFTALAAASQYMFRIGSNNNLTGAINSAQTAFYGTVYDPAINLSGGTSNTVTTFITEYLSGTVTAGTATTWTGLFIGDPTVSGSIGTRYAIVTGANTGNVGIGTITPLNLFSVGSTSQFQINSSGQIAAAAGITSSGTITFSGLTADRLVSTTTGGALTTSIASANVALSVSNETGSGLMVFATAPSVTTLTVSSGGIAVTGNSTIAGTLGSLTGITSSGTITFTGLATSGGLSTRYVCINDTTGVLTKYTNCNLDFNEPMEKGEYLQPGEIVVSTSPRPDQVNSPYYNYSIIKSNTVYQQGIFGVVAEAQEVTEERPHTVNVALTGRVPIIVTSENGNITYNDLLTSSSIRGLGMKATRPGSVVAQALNEFIPTDASCTLINSVDDITWNIWSNWEDIPNPGDSYKQCFKLPNGIYVGKILAFINSSYNVPNSYITKLDEIISDYDSGLLGGSIDTLTNLTISNTLNTNTIFAQNGFFTNISVDNLSVSGNLSITGILTSNQIKANELQAYNSKNIIIKLSEDLGETAFEIQNSLGEAVFKVDSSGKISIKSDSENASVGIETIPANEKEIRIENTSVNENSKIFITPRSVDGIVPALGIKEVGSSYFIVETDAIMEKDIKFDWWLIN